MAQSGQQQNSDDALAPIWITAFLIITGSVIWYYQHEAIVRFMFNLNLLQAKAVNLIWPGHPLSSLITTLENSDLTTVGWSELVELTTLVGTYTRYFYMAIIVVLAFFLYQKDLSTKFCKVYSMKTLRAQEQENWPSIAPVIKEDLWKTDIGQGPWAMALNPMEFSRKYNLLKKNDLLMEASMPGQEMTAALRKADAKRIFTMQLGPIWKDFNACQPHVIALAAIFMARLCRDRESANQISKQLSISFAKGKTDYSSAYPVLEKHKNSFLVQEIVQKHAYVYTVMASLLEAARDDGVVPSSEFLWLKPVDRRLWYTLNCVGRQTPFVEVGGIFAHWKAEKKMNRASLTPMIDEAIKALDIALKEVKLTDKELAELPL
jgi:intracellular multiplication protein IcmP